MAGNAAPHKRLRKAIGRTITAAMSRTKAGSPHDPRGSERFNEERATYTVASAQPDLETGVEVIRDTVRTLKPRPGVYRMLDTRGDVLYVGKARSLKARVANYAQVKGLSNRLKRMVSQCRAMEIVVTNSEAEALLLEAQLIKRYRPPFNVLLRDDKSFPFILLRADHAFPRIQKHRGARRAKGEYYGPFASAGSVNKTLNALQKLFLLRSCTDSFFSNRDRPCLLYQIKGVRPRASAGSMRKAMPAWCARRRISSAENPARCRRAWKSRWRKRPRISISRPRRSCATV